MPPASTGNPPRTGFDNGVIIVGPNDADWIATMFVGAAERQHPVRVAIDDGGVKFKVSNGAWTPPIGIQDPR